MEEGQAAGDRAFVWVDEAFRLPETNTKTCCKSQPEPGLSIYERYTNTSLFKALYPLFFSMKLTGLYFVRNYPEPGCRPRGILPTPSQLFATGCLIIHWLNVIRSLFSFNSEDQFGSELFMKVVFTSFGILASLNVTTLYIACHRSDWLPELFLYWDGLRSLSNQSCVQYVRKRVLGLCVFSWVIIFSSISCNAYIAVSRNMFDMRFLPFTLDMPHFQVVKLVFIIVDLLLNSAWLFPVILTCGTCVVLFKEFSMVNTKLLTILGDLDILAVDMPSIRLRHQNVCKLVEKADKFLCLHMAASFVHNILTICLMLYVLAFDQRFNLDPVVLGISVAWTLTAIVYLGVGCVGGAMVNSQVTHSHDLRQRYQHHCIVYPSFLYNYYASLFPST